MSIFLFAVCSWSAWSDTYLRRARVLLQFDETCVGSTNGLPWMPRSFRCVFTLWTRKDPKSVRCGCWFFVRKDEENDWRVSWGQMKFRGMCVGCQDRNSSGVSISCSFCWSYLKPNYFRPAFQRQKPPSAEAHSDCLWLQVPGWCSSCTRRRSRSSQCRSSGRSCSSLCCCRSALARR